MALAKSHPERGLRASGAPDLLSTALNLRNVAVCLTGLACLSVVIRIVLLTTVQAPMAFSDELGYEELARTIGQSGHLGLFNQQGLSYSPLYPALLAPIFAAGASGSTAYQLIKVVNALLMSLSVFPTYAIARSILSRRHSLIVAAVGTIAPLMFYTSFSISENLAYPLCLFAVWAMLATIRTPSARNDAALLVSIVLATAARVQLVVLLPAALSAVIIASAVEPAERSLRTRARLVLSVHRVLFVGVAGGLVAAGFASLAGVDAWSVLGRYAEVGRASRPNLLHFLNLLVRHLAGIDLAVGVVPFVAAIVTGITFARERFRGAALPFAAVATSVTAWLLVEVAYDAAVFDHPARDIPRIHERFLIYVVPFFLVALFGTVRISEKRASRQVYIAAAAAAAVLPLVIPFHTVVNQTVGLETFGLQPFAHVRHGLLQPIPFAAGAAVLAAAVLGGLFVHVRGQTRAIVLLVLIPLGLISSLAFGRNAATSRYTRSLLPAQMNWVDAAKPGESVVLLTGRDEPTSALETAYANSSIARLYFLCVGAVGSEFGERQATVGPGGTLRGPDGAIQARYVVAPRDLGVLGDVVARNRPGREVLVRVPGGSPAIASRSARCRR